MSTTRSPSRDAIHAFDFRDPSTSDQKTIDYWSYKYIEYCAAEEIVQGYSPTTYGPTGLVTRDQMAVFICRAFDLP
jgi:hypothetical protein